VVSPLPHAQRLAYNSSVKPIDAPLISLVGFAASQWAEQEAGNGHNNGKHRRRLMEIRDAGLELHIRCALYASAPDMLRSLQTVAAHASMALELTNGHEMPQMRSQDPRQDGRRRNGQHGRQDEGAKQGKKQ
jgi:hypothetical protein